MENRRSKILSKTPMVQKIIDVYKISYKLYKISNRFNVKR